MLRSMGRAEKDGRCKKHPSHRNSNGVCPNCLRDRLADLSASSSSSSRNAAGFSTSTASSTAYSSYDDSDDVSSSGESPPRRREIFNGKRLFQVLGGRKKKELKSSLSFSLGEGVERVREKGKKGGGGKLWAKLVMGGGERKKKKVVAEGGPALSHSKTVKEKSSSKWSFFA